MNIRPLVSVIIPAYKSAYFDAALASACQQTYENLEVVICDDSLAEPIGATVRHYQTISTVPIRYHHNAYHRGELFNAVDCITIANGKYIKFLHDDDVLHPECVAELVAAMESDPSISMASSRRHRIDSDSTPIVDILATSFPFSTDVVIDGIQLVSFLAEQTINFIGEPSCVLCRRSDLLAFGADLMSLNGELIYWVGDLALYAKLLQIGNLAFLSRPLSSFRVSREQFSQSGRDKPGLGDKGHADFQRTIRELGWYHGTPENRRVSVSPLVGPRAFQPVDILDQLAKAFAKNQSAEEIRNWLAVRTLSKTERELITAHLSEKDDAPLIGVVVLDLAGQSQALRETLDSLESDACLYRALAVVVLTPDAAAETMASDRVRFIQLQPVNYVTQLNQVIEDSDFDWVMLAQAGEIFTPGGLTIAGLELLPDPDCRAIYGDALFRQESGDVGVGLRPDFNLDYLLSFPSAMATHWLFKRSVLLAAGGFDSDFTQALEFELILRLINQGGMFGFGHISEPFVISSMSVLTDSEGPVRAIRQHLKCRGYDNARIKSPKAGNYAIDYGHEHLPLVSILLVVCDELAAAQRCIISVLEHTQYPHYELVVVDNASTKADTKIWLREIEQLLADRFRVLYLPEQLDRATANNLAAQQAKGEYLLLLRPHVAVFEGRWLHELLNHAQRQEVGIVGAKTISGEGEITHAGLILGLEADGGCAFAGYRHEAAGYMNRLLVDQNYSAVSDACLIIRKSLFDELDGLDAQQFPEEGTDVDLCLRAGQQGYLTVWTPRALLMHSLQASPLTDAAQDALYERWLPLLARDPAYNSNLSLTPQGGFQLSSAQITWRPLAWHPLPVVLAYPADLHGSGNYRVIQPFNAQKEAGLIDGALSGTLLNVAELERFGPQTIILQRQLGDERLSALRKIKKFSNAFKVYELDDYLPNLPVKNLHRLHMPKDIISHLRRALSYVDRFVVSTEPMAEAFKDFHQDIRVVENRLDPRWWGQLPLGKRHISAKPRVGWAGGAGHTGDLELISDVVRELAEEVDWVFFGMCPEKLRPYIKEFHAGIDIASYPAALAGLNLDLALAPVEDNLFNQCKSNLRLLEYGACGYPVVCSDLVCYEGDLPVTRVKNRFKDWVDAIRMYTNDRVAAAQAGDALREVILRDWMLATDNLALWRNAWLAG